MSIYSVFTWRHGSHIGVSKQWNGGHFGLASKFCGSWNLFFFYVEAFFCSNKFAKILATLVKTLYSPSRTWWLLLLVPYVFISVKKPKTQVWVWLPRTLGVTWDNKIAWQRLRDKLQVKSQVLILRKGAITKRRNEKDWKDIKQYPYHDTTNNGFRHTKKHPEYGAIYQGFSAGRRAEVPTIMLLRWVSNAVIHMIRAAVLGSGTRCSWYCLLR